jgi:hypothetical protein
MELRLKRKIPLLFLAACIFTAVVFTETLSADSREHTCTGADCPSCILIEAGHNFLKTLKSTAFLLFAVFLLSFARIFKKYTGFNAYPLSPVTLKVRFNS